MCASGCYRVSGSASLGEPARGVLAHGEALADRGVGYVRARPGEDTRFGTELLVGGLTRAARRVAAEYPGEPIVIGDLSSPFGGRHERHRSHRSGRDADVIFYAVDARGESVRGGGWVAYDAFGVGHTAPDAASGPLLFDVARNWAFVRALLEDPLIEVQWIFCSRGVKSALLLHALQTEVSDAVLEKAAWVLHQPGRGVPHDDHFHVRIYCGHDERVLGCVDGPPAWPWRSRPDAEARVAASDDALVSWLLEP